MSTNLLTTSWGFGGRYRQAWAGPLDQKIVTVNGFNANLFYYSKTGLLVELGLDPPAVAPTGSAGTPAGSGITGTFRYRTRRWDKVNGTLSLPSPELTMTAAAQDVTITRPAEVTQRTATHWILERTTNNGAVWFPINTWAAGVSVPDGTAIGTTTYVDATPDDDAFAFHAILGEFQCRPRTYRLAVMSDVRLFLAGGVIHAGSIGATNASTALTAASDFFSKRMVDEGWQVSLGDADGSLYTLGGFTNARSVALTAAYRGATATKTGGKVFSPNCNRFAWSEPFQPEYFGAAEITGPENEEQVGDARPITALVALGKFDSVSHVLVAKADRIYAVIYTASPSLQDGGRIVELPARRGALGSRSVLAIDGRVFGMDTRGVWTLDNGSTPLEIGSPLRSDWTEQSLNFEAGEEFWIGHEPDLQQILFWVVPLGQTKATKAYVYDLARSAFVGTRRYARAHTAGVEIADGGAWRAHSFSEAVAS